MISLQGPGAVLGGGTITNLGTIKGAGQIANIITNSLGTIRAENGELDFTAAAITNSSGQIQAPAGGTVMFTGADIQTNAATIVLDGPAARIVDQSNSDALANFT